MKKYSVQELKTIRSHLENGTVYCGIDRQGYGIGRIYMSGDNDKYIYYENYGSSAIKNNNSDLKWLLNTIFDECSEITPTKYSEYHLNYIPIDTRFKGIDRSTEHPNVCGL